VVFMAAEFNDLYLLTTFRGDRICRFEIIANLSVHHFGLKMPINISKWEL